MNRDLREVSSLHQDLLNALGEVLRLALRRKGLLSSSPRFLGYCADNWFEDGVMDELVEDFYCYLFVSRLPGLENSLARGLELSGFIKWHARNFLHNLQVEADPVGYRVYGWVVQAISSLLERGEVRVLDIDLSSDSVVRFHGRNREQASEELIGGYVNAWPSDVIFALLGARTLRVPVALDGLAGKILGLRESGVQMFKVGHLVGALKERTRNLAADGILGDPIAASDEDSQRYGRLICCVSRAVENAPGTRERGELRALWAIVLSGMYKGKAIEGKIPTALIARELNVPRYRADKIRKMLGNIVVQCQDCAENC